MRRLQVFFLAVALSGCLGALAQADSATEVSILHVWVAAPDPRSGHRIVTLEVSIENDGSVDANYPAPVMLSENGKTYVTSTDFGGLVLGSHAAFGPYAAFTMKLVFNVDNPGHYRLRVHNATTDSDEYKDVTVR